jgi:ArsR family transcriptional regulator
MEWIEQMAFETQISQIRNDFLHSRKILIAIGDETRQLILVALMGAGCDGMRVGEVTAQIHLSRPAVSHHLKILLNCGLVGVDKQGTKNYYFLNISDEFMSIYNLANHIVQLNDTAKTLGGQSCNI